MKAYLIRGIKLYIGLFIYALAIRVNINAGLGMPPWDLFHTGISDQVGFTFGQVVVFFSVLIVCMNVFWFKERVGIGTLSNMVLVGINSDIIQRLGLVPHANSLFTGLVQMLIGMGIMCVAMYLYIGAGYGAGPRDGMFIGMSKKFHISPKMAKTIVEVVVFAIGVLLGAHWGIGTAVFAFGFGPLMQWGFKLMKFDVQGVDHLYLDDIFRNMKKRKLAGAGEKPALEKKESSFTE